MSERLCPFMLSIINYYIYFTFITVEAVATAIYIMNRCPTKSMKNKFPQEEWTSMNHSVSHLKVFSCVAYAHVPDEVRKKLDKKVEKCIFVGYYEDTKAYKLYDPVARKVIISRDVQFFENESLGWNRRHKCQDCVKCRQ